MASDNTRYFHLHLVSDSTGETLTAIARAAAVQYSMTSAVEHVHPLVRTKRQLDRVLQTINDNPGIVLYTIVGDELSEQLEKSCKEINLPCVPVLQPVMKVFESYLGAPSTPTVGGQHVLDQDYFRRIEAMNFTLVHDDGNFPEDVSEADIVVMGISRTSKTPTSIYLANRGFKTANVPLVPGIPLPQQLIDNPNGAFVVALIASPERISEVRMNRVNTLSNAKSDLKDYVDVDLISEEINYTRRLCAKNNWKIIDVSRRSIEETAASIIQLYQSSKASSKGYK